MEGIITAWGKILRGYNPSLSIEITRECPLRCPGCYAYGDEHLGGDVTLRQVTDYKGQELVDRVVAMVDEEKPIHVSIVGGEPLVRFRELNEILPKLAARGDLHAGRHQRGPADPGRVGVDSAPADRRLDRRPAAGARRAAHAGHLRSHPETHRRPAHHRALHDHAAAGPARRLPRGVRPHLVGEPARPAALVQPLHAAGRRSVAGDPDARRPRARRRGADVAARRAPEDPDARGAAEKIRAAAAKPGRLRVRADDDLRVGRLRAPDHAVPVRRHAGLLPVRLHRVGGACRRRRPPAAGRPPGRGDLRRVAPRGARDAPAPAGRPPADGVSVGD